MYTAPKISVVVPVYNVVKYLNRCVDSILKQSYRNLEILLIDDGSTDGSGAICDEYTNIDERILVFHKINGGLSSARNVGLLKATGDYISFIDSDDWLGKNFYSNLIEGIKENADIIIGDYTITIGDSEKKYSFKSNIEERLYIGEDNKLFFLKELLEQGNYMSVWRNLYSVRFLRDNGIIFFSEREIYAEDDYFNTIAYYFSRQIYKSNSAEYFHMINKGSLSQSYRPQLFKKSMNRFRLKKEFLKRNNSISYCLLLENKLPNIVATCLYKESLCSFKIAIKNIREICKDSDYIFNKWGYSIGKYKFLYFLAKNEMHLCIVIFSKLFAICEPIYRFFSLNFRS